VLNPVHLCLYTDSQTDKRTNEYSYIESARRHDQEYIHFIGLYFLGSILSFKIRISNLTYYYFYVMITPNNSFLESSHMTFPYDSLSKYSKSYFLLYQLIPFEIDCVFNIFLAIFVVLILLSFQKSFSIVIRNYN